jgi:outer membrane lipopolysaccharide assembly protein LptE/RlpB
LFLINSRILVLIASFKSVLEHLQFRCCSWNLKNSSHLIFQELPLNSSRTVEAQFKNVQEQLHQNNSWKVLNDSRIVLKVFAEG